MNNTLDNITYEPKLVYRFFIKLWDDEKIEIDEDGYNKLEYGTWISVVRVSKIADVTIPLTSIKLWYRVRVWE